MALESCSAPPPVCNPGRQRGFLLIMSVVLIVVAALALTVMVYFSVTGNQATVRHLGSKQALFIAESGMERARYAYRSGTACGALSFTDVAFGQGRFTATGTAYNPSPSSTLAAAVGAGDTVIPLASTAGYAPHGRVRIGSEEIDYAGIAGNDLTGARRGVAGSTAAGHAVGTSVLQNLCLVRSVGSIDNRAHRTVETTLHGTSAAYFLDGGTVGFRNTATTLGSLTTDLPAGDTVVIAAVALRNTGGARTINPGDLQLRRGAVTLATNQFLARVGGGANPNNNRFPQETQFLLFRDAAAPASPAYSVSARTSAGGVTVSGEVKLLAFNAVPASSFQDGGSVAIGAGQTTILAHASGLPAGDNVIVAAVQFENTHANQVRSIAAGNLRLQRGAVTLATNQYTIDLARNNRVNNGTGFLLLARDPGAPANAVYSVSAQANNAGINGEAKILVLNGLESDIAVGTANIGTADTVMANLATGFPAGENIVLAATQYDNSSNAQRNILAGNEGLVYAGTPPAPAASQFDLNLCRSNTAECDDFAGGLLWHQPAAVPGPAYDVRARASAAGIAGAARLLAIHLDVPVIGWREVYQ